MIKCCKDCVAPKRHPGCNGNCPEYIEERAEYDKQKAAADLQRRARAQVLNQRDYAVNKALKKNRRRQCGGSY